MQEDDHLLTLAPYVERNPLRARMVERAEHWAYSSLSQRTASGGKTPPLTAMPMPLRGDWLQWVNEPQTDKEIEQLRCSVQRGRPFGDEVWQARTASRLGLAFTFRKRGRAAKIVS